jgi:hypothetical protein
VVMKNGFPVLMRQAGDLVPVLAALHGLSLSLDE